MRYPIKFIVPVTVVLPLLAAYGTRAWFEDRLKRRWTVCLAVALALSATALAIFSACRPAPGEAVGQTGRSAAVAVVCLAALFSLFRIANRSRQAWPPWLFPLAIIATIFGDLAMPNRHINPVVHPQVLTGNVAVLEPRPAVGTSRAMVSVAAHQAMDAKIFSSPEAAAQIPRQALLLNANLIERVPKLDGFFSLYLPETASLFAHLATHASDPAVKGLLDFTGVSHVNHPDKPWIWVLRTNWLPMLNLAPRALPLDPAKKFQPLVSQDFNPTEYLYLPPDAARQVRADGSGRGRIVSSRITHRSVEAILETDKPMLLSVAQANYPGWRATVDGKQVPLWTANYAFQGLEVPAGRHEVKVDFRSASFETGGLITAVSLVACWAACWRCRSRRKRVSIGAQADQAANAE